MKSRPRSVENRVADMLNEHFLALNMSEVERIPVLGRTGPDISINEMKLVVDVKSRIEVPKSIFFPLLVPFEFDGMTGVRLKNMTSLWETDISAPLDISSKIIRDYLAHMEEWTVKKCKDGISAIILHRPKIPIGESVLIINSNSRRRLFRNDTN